MSLKSDLNILETVLTDIIEAKPNSQIQKILKLGIIPNLKMVIQFLELWVGKGT